MFLITLSVYCIGPVSAYTGAIYPISEIDAYASQSDVNDGIIVWIQDNEVFQYDGNDIIKLTSDSFVDSSPETSDGWVTWEQMDGNDKEIFLFDGAQIIQITDNSVDDLLPQVDDGQVVWYASDGVDTEIYLFDGDQIIQLSNNDYNDLKPRIHQGLVTWYGFEGGGSEIFLYTGVETRQITDDILYHVDPEIDDGQIVWQTHDLLEDEAWVHFYDGTQTIQVFYTTDYEGYPYYPDLDNGEVTWQDEEVVYYWDGAQVDFVHSHMGGVMESWPQIQDGVVIFSSYLGDLDFGILTYDGSEVTVIAMSEYLLDYPHIMGGSYYWEETDTSFSVITQWIDTNLQLNVDSEITLGSPISILGSYATVEGLQIPDEQVILYTKHETENDWTPLYITFTDGLGEIDVLWEPPQIGVYFIKAVTEGTESYLFDGVETVTSFTVVQPVQETIEIQLYSGWNLVSFAVLPADASTSNVLDDIGFNQVVTWTGTEYIYVTSLELWKGYWILVLDDSTISYQT